jgi:hypothetical protein
LAAFGLLRSLIQLCDANGTKEEGAKWRKELERLESKGKNPK